MFGRFLTGGAGLFGGFPIWLWIIGGLMVALVGEEGLRRVQTSGLRADVAAQVAGRAQDRADAATAALKKAKEYADETTRRLVAQEKAQHEHDQSLAQARTDAAAAAVAAGGLRRQLAAFAAANRGATGNTAAGVVGATAADPVLLLTELLGRADQRAGELAEYADLARIAGQQCTRSYESLTQVRSPP